MFGSGYLSAYKSVNCYMSWTPAVLSQFFTHNNMVPTIRTIIADDETLARQKLRILLQEEPGIQVVAECKNGEETLDALNTYRADLLLLDIQMPDANGLDLLK